MQWLKMSAFLLATLSMPAVAQEAGEGAANEVAVAPGPFIVFFDWDGRSIARDDGDILAEVLAAYRANPDYQLSLIGHSDRSGPAGHNRILAERRARVVRDYLVEQGVAASAMKISSAGEDRPLIATADGVREAQNRRVEIEFVN